MAKPRRSSQTPTSAILGAARNAVLVVGFGAFDILYDAASATLSVAQMLRTEILRQANREATWRAREAMRVSRAEMITPDVSAQDASHVVQTPPPKPSKTQAN
jgi:hypothetical protein